MDFYIAIGAIGIIILGIFIDAIKKYRTDDDEVVNKHKIFGKRE